MKRSISRWTMAATAAALLAVPATGTAQTSGTSTPQTQSPSSTATPQASEAAREHLSKAKAALDEVQTTSVDAKARAQITELKKRMTALERAAGMNDNSTATAQQNRNPRATANRGNSNWGTEVAAIDKALTTLLGSASTTGATGTTTPPATGTSGSTSATAGAGMKLDETTRTKLMEVRTHITAFATAMAGGRTEASPEPTSTTRATGATTGTTGATSATGTSGTSSPTSATGSSATSGAATSGSATSGSTTQQPPATTPAQGTAAAQVDEDAARRHLTEARNSLSAMTQLPAAGQLQGEARTQVSQLITNFNELITTQTEWRATYAKLEANLTALLGPDPAGSGSSAATAGTAAAGTAGATGTTGTTGTTGATAGTSGTATVELDPALREKLVELRRHLTEFEKAAGGGAAASASTSTPASPTSPMTSGAAGTSSAAGTSAAGSSATGSSTSGTTGATGTTGSTTSTTDPSAAQSTQAGSQDLMKHVAAIDALLKMQDDSGGLTLTKAQVEQLRTHWAAVQAALQRR